MFGTELASYSLPHAAESHTQIKLLSKLLTNGYYPLATGYWLLATGYWLLATDKELIL
jgi:hypothetical protein